MSHISINRKLGEARKTFRRMFDRSMTQEKMAQELSVYTRRMFNRQSVGQLETSSKYRVTEDIRYAYEQILRLDPEYLSGGYEGPVLFKSRADLNQKPGTTSVGERRRSYVAVARAHGSNMWRRSEVSVSSRLVPVFLMAYEEFVEVPDISLMPFIEPGHVLAFARAHIPVLGKVHLFQKVDDPDFRALREIRENANGKPELFTPGEDATAISLETWTPSWYLVAVSTRLQPFRGLIDEEGLSFEAARRAR